jgi:hypothetical protein
MSASRIVGILGVVVAITGALTAGGLLPLLPPKYAWAGGVVAAVGATAAGLSERIQGGVSKQ